MKSCYRIATPLATELMRPSHMTYSDSELLTMKQSVIG